MLEYRFKNLTIKYGGEDFLVSGTARYEIEDYEEDGREASFLSAEVIDALSKIGYVTSKECLTYLGEGVCEHLNKDSYLCRQLGNKF